MLAEIAERVRPHDVSIETRVAGGVRRRGALVFITHRAREGAFQEAVAELRGAPGRRARSAASCGWRARSERWRRTVARRDRGVPRPAAGRPTARRSSRSARAARRSSAPRPCRRDRVRGLPQVRGREPDRLVQGPRDDARDLQGASRRARRRSCAPRPATPAPPPPRTRRKAGLTCAVLVPKGKVAPGKMAATLVHGARVLEVEGNFDASFELARDLAERYPVTLVNSVNPFRLQGQKTGAFEIVRRARSRARPPLPAGGQRRATSRATGWATRSTSPTGRSTSRRGCSGSRRPAPRRSCAATRSRTRRRSPPRSGSGTPRRGTWPSRPRASPRARSWRSPTARSSPPTGGSRARGCSPSRRRPRASPGCSGSRTRAGSRAARPSSACSPGTG